MSRRQVWGITAAAFVAVSAVGFAVAAVQEDQVPPVTVGVPQPAASQVPKSRAGLVKAWTAELKHAGKDLPQGWEALTTDEIRGRYLHQRILNAPTAEDIDPDMGRRVDGSLRTGEHRSASEFSRRD
ncbi:hypothetical protein OH809_35735 [Streptomyces sp. NBC_00873]|uniref:hypothetical protein n=1 Tax=unclassified Streptomyces TaxID=2593676 RepID=UPI00386DEA13|nr:hypothetical protein OH809_35735 [Streptomyces sp. NBC_00873]WTA42551.1 hypothetical protein OH821_07975 [Streptomyces sp. NBC_00842]